MSAPHSARILAMSSRKEARAQSRGTQAASTCTHCSTAGSAKHDTHSLFESPFPSPYLRSDRSTRRDSVDRQARCSGSTRGTEGSDSSSSTACRGLGCVPLLYQGCTRAASLSSRGMSGGSRRCTCTARCTCASPCRKGNSEPRSSTSAASSSASANAPRRRPSRAASLSSSRRMRRTPTFLSLKLQSGAWRAMRCAVVPASSLMPRSTAKRTPLSTRSGSSLSTLK
mmetsp:Transcript_8660/g.18393  ORF Transcript_8660/g.18393 Transcript_8660/m.18393 type:complete len:227 (-) Transcript_8660:728-1408(-)